MKYFLWAILLLVETSAFAGPCQAKLPEEFNAVVTRVIDGDTFKFKASIMNVNIHDTCRMREYNAPELHGKEQAEGEAAKHELITLIGGKRIRISTHGKDKYGRQLCTATTGTLSVGAVMKDYLKDYAGRNKYQKQH